MYWARRGKVTEATKPDQFDSVLLQIAENREVWWALGKRHWWTCSNLSACAACEFRGITPPKEISNSLFSLKCCEEAVLYNRVGVTVFITSWRATGLGVLTEWKNTCRSPVWSFARMGDSASAAGRAASSPGAGETAKAVSRSAPQCVAPGGTSLAAVT